MPDFRQQANRGQTIFFIMFMMYLMMSSPPEDAGFPPVQERHEILDQFKDELRTSRESIVASYSTGYGNLTGLKLSYDDALQGRNASEWPFPDKSGLKFSEDEKTSILPNQVSELASKIWNTEDSLISLPSHEQQLEVKESKRHNDGVFWYNLTGTIRGEFTKSETQFTPIHMPLPKYFKTFADYKDSTGSIDFEDPSQDSSSEQTPPSFQSSSNIVGNVTYPSGILKLELENKNITSRSKDTTYVGLNLILNNHKENDDHILQLTGVYHQSTGNLVAVTRSAKFAGIYALPQLNLQDDSYYNQTQELMNYTTTLASDDVEFGRVEELLEQSEKCEYISYLHFESTELSHDDMRRVDDELITPLGRPKREIPKIKLTSGLLYSPDCGFMLNINESIGPRKEVQRSALRNSILLGIAVVFSQIWLFIRQMNATNTPSTLSRIAFWTIAIINLADGSMSMVALLCSMIFSKVYIQFAVLAFLAFTCSSIYEMRYLIQIYLSQMNERTINWRTALQGTSIEERQQRQQEQQQQEGGLPAPVTTPATAPEDEQSVSASLYTKSFFSLLVFLFFILNVILWPKTQRRVFEYILCIIFNSYWIPQISRNVIRGSRKSFTWEFILCTSFIRLVPIATVCLFPNPFYHHHDTALVTVVVILLGVQVALLYLQEILGPRFFLPEKYLPKTYDYHPVLTTNDLEGGYVDDNQRNIVNHKCKIDCAICMQTFDVPIIEKSPTYTLEGGTSSDDDGSSNPLLASVNILARRNYMVTPCKHIFHTDCLENWMKYKLQCPVCRNSLPPL